MVEPERWTIAERYMVRYHLSHLVWWALGSISLLIVGSGAVLALTTLRTLPPQASLKVLWYATFVVTPLLTGASFLLKDHLLGRVYLDWELHRVVMHYKRTLVYAFTLCLIAGIVPVVVAGIAGRLSYPLLIELVPLAALFVHFPHQERFVILVEDLVHAPSM